MKPLSWTLPPLDWTAIDAIAAGRRVVADSRRVAPGDAFLAYRGEYADGRHHIAAAVAAGAGAVLWEEEGFSWDPAWNVRNLPVANLRDQAGIVAAHLLGNPSSHMHCVGVTGTNGKTSCASWLAQAYDVLGHKAAVVGTTGYGFIGALQEASHTTPDAVRLQNLVAEYYAAGATHLAMEVSSHGLKQARAHGMAFEAAIFTNLSRDHLDYHGSMEDYGASKRMLFDWEGLRHAVINVDDPFGAEILASLPAGLGLGYGVHGGDLRAERIDTSLDGLHLEIASDWGKLTLVTPLIGRFNAYNMLACLGVLLRTGVAPADAVDALSKVQPAKGRMQRMGGGDKPLILVDYAHTPDALEKALTTVREIMPENGRLFCVFGCGGDRDRGKRSIMGSIACTYADTVIITNDNPRTENPKRIIADILDGVGIEPGKAGTQHRGDYCVESDRAGAIRSAIELARAGDVVLIAGKGHEDYQEVNGVRHHFSDAEQAEAVLKSWRPMR
ncbi:MAG: UDP-N-acetylmuramoyl-L-alanyl-D-glutamate--2,6-diaminopimelate ligase [Burkholderiales bacterium]|nr:UDP-N-acetylmuramoyl-L-alanyl-D-glutamate--2,6-diaminopimelate ligase [Burkholderiales bacterium]